MFLKKICPASSSARLYWVTQLFFAGLLGLQMVVYALAPFSSLHPTQPVWLTLAGFYATFAASSALLLFGFGRNHKPPLQTHYFATYFDSEKLRRLLVAISLLGLVLHVYSKYYLTSIRPVHCLSEIRFAWLEVSHDMLPWYVQAASMAGHLLCGFSYVGAFIASMLMMRAYCKTQPVLRLAIYLIIFIAIGTIYAGFISSRNVVVAYLVLSFCGSLLGLCLAPIQWQRALKGLLLTTLLPLFMATGFSTTIFLDRIYCGTHLAPITAANIAPASSYLDEGGAAALPRKKASLQTPQALLRAAKNDVVAATASNYFVSNCKAFDIQCQRPDSAANPLLKMLWSTCRSCPSTMLYFNHGVMNFAQITDTEQRGTPVLFSFGRSLAKRFGLIDATEPGKAIPRVFGSGGTTLAGGIYHDYGRSGILFFGLLFGIIYGFALILMERARGQLLGVWLFVCSFYVMAISTIFVGMNVLPFPFVVTGSALTFAALALLHYPLSKRRE